LAELRESPVLESIPVVILSTSASGSETDIPGELSIHENCHLTKTVDLEGFLKVVRSIDSFLVVGG
jgi:hypothetical protein